MKRGLLFEVGINDADYNVTKRVDGKLVVCTYYKTWQNLIRRSYSDYYHSTRPTYKGCTVCDEWLYFSNFKKWMEKQDWKGKALDKDLLSNGGKLYSPETCVFIDPALNSCLTMGEASRGLLPVGVNLFRGKYQSRCHMGKSNKRRSLGYHLDPMTAHRKWQIAKIEALESFLEGSCERTVQGILRVISKIQSDYDNNLETKSLFWS